jgi:phenylalanyl-tRNA synthetase beta chain
MRIPLEWLAEYCDSGLDAFHLAERLAATGTEVERVEHHGVESTDGFVIGYVESRVKHPDADRLNVCMVDIGEAEPVQIVCGAPNVDKEMTVGVVRPGARMPDGTKIKKSKLRGVESNGMILSERELGISHEHDGIMVLHSGPAGTAAAADPRLTPGKPLADVVPMSTPVLVLEITPNRPDCLGLYGVAREVAASTGAPLKAPPWEAANESELATRLALTDSLDGVQVTVESPDLCPRFTARVFDDVKQGQSPLWMKARLMACGMRPINSVVDITNYVMLLTGQPMHAFDYDRVADHRLNVRHAVAGERLMSLDEQERELTPAMLVIEDGDGPTSIAGVMGGARSEVQDDTTKLLLEAATWDGPNIHDTSFALALRSEASGRNEKGLQPEQTLWAQVVASKLYAEICGATVQPGTLDIGGPGPAPLTIRLRDARVAGLLGIEIPRERSRQLLETIGFSAADADDGLDVTVPDFRRADITREADLIEEVSRLDGVERLPATLPSRKIDLDNLPADHSGVAGLTARQRQRRRAADALTAQGLSEMVGWSLVGPDMAGKLRLTDPEHPLTIANPMSIEQSQMRTSLIGGVLDVVSRNNARGAGAVKLFELGAVYHSASDGKLVDLSNEHSGNRIESGHEPQHLAAVLSGPVRPPTWRNPDPDRADFFAAKGALAGLFDKLGSDWSLAPLCADTNSADTNSGAAAPFLHPGRSARVIVNDGEGNPADIGWVGEIHPAVTAAWEIEETVAGFELNLDEVPVSATALYTDLTSFPAVNEDLAVVVADTVSAQQVLDAVRKAAGKLLAEASVFDVYRDAERLGAGKVSLAIRLSYRAADRTLTDEEVGKQRKKVIAALESELGGTIRA